MTQNYDSLFEQVEEKVKNSSELEMYEEMLLEYQWERPEEMLEFFLAQSEEDLIDWLEAVLARSEDDNLTWQGAADKLVDGPEDWEKDFQNEEI